MKCYLLPGNPLDNLSHILVIDYDPDIHAFIKHDLKNQPFNIVSAYTIDEAVEALSSYGRRP